MTRSKSNRSKDLSPRSEFVEVVEKYLTEAEWTKQQLMAAIKVGETQFYRWARGENVPTKAIVNRIAAVLARQIDEIHREIPSNPFPASDRIDGLLNELLEAAGYKASIKGKGSDSSWYQIAQQKTWTLGYTSIPRWSEIPNPGDSKPSGLAIEYAERIARLLGISTNWKYLDFEQMALAIQERQVDGIAPFMLVLPERFFSFRFSEQCSADTYSLSALVSPNCAGGAVCLEDLPSKKVKLLYIKGELADWGVSFLGSSYQNQPFEYNREAISYLLANTSNTPQNEEIDTNIPQNEDIIVPVYLVDSFTADFLAEENNLKVLKIETINLQTHSAFAFHPDEDKLITAVNYAIQLTPKIIKSKND